MELEQLVTPVWFAKKLPKNIDSLFIWWIWGNGEVYLTAKHHKDDLKGYEWYPAPTMQELLPLLKIQRIRDLVVDNHIDPWNTQLARAFRLELEGAEKGWKYLDQLLFPKV